MRNTGLNMIRDHMERILVPTDTSEFAGLALQYALLFQKRLGSKITLMYAEEFSLPLNAEYPIGYYFENLSEAKERAGEQLRKYARDHVPEVVPVTTLIVDDLPARGILTTAEDLDADLIIMGTHGRHGLRRALLGSVTEHVLRGAKCPVLTVTPGLSPANREANFRTILCPVNFTAVAHDALDRACELANAFGTQLIVMHVAEPGDTTGDSIEERFHTWVDPRVRNCTRYEPLVTGGNPAARVLEVADQNGVDLIVIGAQHRRFSDATVIGTTTERITRFARQPVLTVVRGAAAEPSREREAELVATAS